MGDQEFREKVIEKGKKIEDTETNNLSKVQLRQINGKLKRKNISRDFHLQCISDLQDSKMPIGDFLATMLDGNWQDYGETQEEVEAAKDLIRRWSKKYLSSEGTDDFMSNLGA